MDWVRGLASCAVVLFHLNEVPPRPESWYGALCKLGWLGVPAFFVISGWCMSALTDRKPIPFMLARLIRIFPPYWASLALVLAVAGFRYILTGHNDVAVLPSNVGEVLATVFLATEPLTTVSTINWVYWSLTFEIAFYVLCTAALASGFPQLVIILVFLAGILITQVWDNSLTYTPLFWCSQFPVFVIGWIGHRLAQNGGPTKTLLLLGGLVIGAFATNSFQESVVAVGTVGVLILGHRFSMRSLNTTKLGRALSFLGACSYSLYLIHVPLGCHVMLPFQKSFLPSNVLITVVSDLLILALCIGSAALFHRFVEQPFHQMSRRFSEVERRGHVTLIAS